MRSRFLAVLAAALVALASMGILAGESIALTRVTGGIPPGTPPSSSSPETFQVWCLDAQYLEWRLNNRHHTCTTLDSEVNASGNSVTTMYVYFSKDFPKTGYTGEAMPVYYKVTACFSSSGEKLKPSSKECVPPSS